MRERSKLSFQFGVVLLFAYAVPTAHKKHQKKILHTSSQEKFLMNCPQIVKI